MRIGIADLVYQRRELLFELRRYRCCSRPSGRFSWLGSTIRWCRLLVGILRVSHQVIHQLVRSGAQNNLEVCVKCILVLVQECIDCVSHLSIDHHPADNRPGYNSLRIQEPKGTNSLRLQ